MEERARRATPLLVTTVAKRAPLIHSRGRISAPHKVTHGSPLAVYTHRVFTPDATLGYPPSAGEGIIPHLPGYEERYRTFSFKDNLADHWDSDIIDSPNIPPKVMEQPIRARAFQPPFKLSASCTSAREAVDKKDSNSNSIKKKKKRMSCLSQARWKRIIDSNWPARRPRYSCFSMITTSRGRPHEATRSKTAINTTYPPMRHVATYPAQATNGKAQHSSAYHPHPPRSMTICLGRHSSFPEEHIPNWNPNGQVSLRTLGLLILATPTSEDMKS
jgi:hypothetical protein